MNKDIIILALSFCLVISLLRAAQLKRSLLKEIRKRLYPLLSLELVKDVTNNNYGLDIKNEGYFPVKNIKVNDLKIAINDCGFRQNVVLRFDEIDELREKQKIRLTIRTFDAENNAIANVETNLIPHIVNINFEVSISYRTIWNTKLLAKFIKKQDKFYLEKITYLKA
ncbi:MAG: hypothetical protein Q8L26_07150 [Candidatus Omnitrophota bacterium]|nr:hypothetical protein [Candidatus Omnitrophota bacterium]